MVAIILLVTLRDWRGALISFSAIPLTLLGSVWILSAAGLSLNTMTLGGLVVALGVVVDDAVIDVENILRRRRSADDGGSIGRLFMSASLEVRRPVFFATAAVAVAFLPILTMSGLQGAFFRPLSIAFLVAVGLSLVVAMSVTPALCQLSMSRHRPHPEAAFLRRCKSWQQAGIDWLQARPRMLTALLVSSFIAGVAGLTLLGARLLPDFRENYLIVHASLRPGIALAEVRRVGAQISGRLAALPGVKSVAEQIGRAENGQDPDTPNKSEFEVQIDPGRGRSAAQIDADIRKVFDEYPNQLVEIYSVLAERIGETLSGESAAFSISVMGSDLDVDDRVGAQIVQVLRGIPGSGNVRLLVPPRQVELQLEWLPEQLALRGPDGADRRSVPIETAFQARLPSGHGVQGAPRLRAVRAAPIAFSSAESRLQ